MQRRVARLARCTPALAADVVADTAGCSKVDLGEMLVSLTAPAGIAQRRSPPTMERGGVAGLTRRPVGVAVVGGPCRSNSRTPPPKRCP